ncbi:MAG: hypothetical protein RLZ61_850, partial [Planctomycetota bacterium]
MLFSSNQGSVTSRIASFFGKQLGLEFLKLLEQEIRINFGESFAPESDSIKSA